MELESQVIEDFSKAIDDIMKIDPDVIKSVTEGDSNVRYLELLQGIFRSVDLIIAEGLMTEDQAFGAKIELANALTWAGSQLREFQRS